MNLLRKTAALSAIALCCTGLQAEPAPDAQAYAPPGTLDDDTCIEVEVNGEKAPSYACLTLKLKSRPAPSAGAAGQPALGSEKILQKSDNQLGLFNRATTSHRMGNAFGNSVTPQRPAR